MEETTGVGYGTGTGYGTAGGISGTGEAKGSVGGTIKEYREGGVNMAFLDNYFSEVMTWSFFRAIYVRLLLHYPPKMRLWKHKIVESQKHRIIETWSH